MGDTFSAQVNAGVKVHVADAVNGNDYVNLNVDERESDRD